MELYDAVARRKSCRKYNMEPLDLAMLEKIDTVIKELVPLYNDVALKHRFTKEVKGRFHVNAPHYLIISGGGDAREMENAGFIFEQLVLWFDLNDIGCVWLGASKDKENHNDNDIISIAFGKPVESLHRLQNEFKRKPIDKITNDIDDVCIKAAHLAPSGMNTQAWFFLKQADKVLVYKQKLKPPMSLIYKLVDIDMGIALCHYAVAAKKINQVFNFSKSTELPLKQGYLPFGIIQ